MSPLSSEAREISAPADDHASLFLETVSAALDRMRWELGLQTLEDLEDERLAALIESAVQEANAALGT